ncbi:hypothetical protein V6N11_018892 [Hibiscus sabdariffa]|uniref:RVP_2 domain-containing protein n=1 Tax=Hibiscus sabdariffa TaxID=183260 RepID=A0ABR2R0W0_9ROSI
MRSLCSVFDVKKQGKPVWEVRTRYWKLREGENRLFVVARVCDAQFYASLVLITGTSMVVSVPDSSLESVYRYYHMGTEPRLCDNREDQGTHCYILPLENVILVKRLEHLGSLPLLTHVSLVCCRVGNEETLPPLPPVGGEANDGSAGPQGGPARVYAHREGRNDTDVIAGNFSIQSLSLLSLIDSGSTHSYILSEHARLLDVGVNVTSSFGDTIVVRKLYRRCLLMIQGYLFLVDMMELPFYGFDVILGMDWLVEHRARVDFETKRVSLKLADDHEIVVMGENIKFLSNVISVLEAQRLMYNGCRAYLAYVMNPNMGEARPRDIRTVCDFSGVFPEELHDLPPDREVEFAIETYSNSAPMSISPYRMAPKELKTQLQELLD